VFAWLPKDTASNTIQIRASLWKGRSGISPSQTSYISTWCSYCITHQTCYYLQVHLNELYTECSETARTCANSGYHTLLSNFCRVLENEANPDFAPWAPDHVLLTLPSLTQEEVQDIEVSEVLAVNRVIGKVGQVSQHLQLNI